MTATTITLDIGARAVGPARVTKVYQLHETLAPAAYDGFGTLTLADDGESVNPRRFVLIEAQHVQWQLARYISGMHAAVASDVFSADDIAERLFGAITQTFSRET